MFDGLNNNRAHWNELAEVYNAKMKAIEDEKKKLEEEEARKCKYICRFAYCGPVDDLMRMFSGEKFCIFFSVCSSSWRWREVKNLHHLLSSSGVYEAGLMRSG